MTLTILSIIYVIVAIAMVAFILMQRGAGAQAGSGFGAGASATVFGARGAASFLTRATAAMAIMFFVVSLGMGIFIAHRFGPDATPDLGVMGRAAPATEVAPAVPPPAGDVPAAPTEVPAPASATAPVGEVPAPAEAAPAPQREPPQQPEPNN